MEIKLSRQYAPLITSALFYEGKGSLKERETYRQFIEKLHRYGQTVIRARHGGKCVARCCEYASREILAGEVITWRSSAGTTAQFFVQPDGNSLHSTATVEMHEYCFRRFALSFKKEDLFEADIVKCILCNSGHPISDPLYRALRIGPDCYRRYLSDGNVPLLNNFSVEGAITLVNDFNPHGVIKSPDVPPIREIVHQPAETSTQAEPQRSAEPDSPIHRGVPITSAAKAASAYAEAEAVTNG